MADKIRYFVQGFWVDRHLAQWITSIMMAINLGLGTAIIVGGVDRFPPPSYEPLITYSNGNTWIWGVWIAFAALLMTFPFRWPSIAGLWLSMVWHIIWMACFTISAVNYENSAATPIPVYGGLAMFSAALLTARVIEKTEG